MPDELWEIASRYWEHAGVNEYGKVVWARPAKSVSVTGWRGAVHHVAGAGAVAVLLGKTCTECGGPLTLSSRTALETGLIDVNTRCCTCTSNYVENVLLVGGPGADNLRLLQRQKTEAKQVAARAAKEAEAVQQRLLDQLEQERREVIAAQYPLQFHQAFPDPRSVSFRARLTTLALLEYAAESGIIDPVSEQDIDLAPSQQQASDLIHEANGKMLVTHPSSPTRAFAWAAREDQKTPNWNGYYPLLTRLHLGLGNPDPELWTSTRDSISAALQPSNLTEVEQKTMLNIAAELVGGEALRYLNFKLKDEYRLPELSDELRPRTLDLLTFAAHRLSLGHLIRAIWTVTSGATNLKASKPHMPRQQITNHTIKRLEEKIHDFLSPGYKLLDPYRVDSRLPLSAITRTLFYEVIHADPLISSLSDIQNLLPEPSETYARELCQTGIPDGEEARDALLASSSNWDGEMFRRALAEIESRTFQACVPGCAHDRQQDLASQLGTSFDRLVSRIGGDSASIALIETIRYTNTPPTGRPGDLLLTLIAEELGIA